MGRMGKLVMMAALPLALLAAQAQAQYVDIEQRLTPEQLREVGLRPEQLARLNALLRQAEPPAAAQPVPAVEASAIEGPPQQPAARGMFIGLDDKPVSSRVRGDVASWAPGTVFELENGQQWKVLKGSMTLRNTLQSPQVAVVPGVAGRWFLEVDPDLPKARVYRIR
jgi:hypothetical protein